MYTEFDRLNTYLDSLEPPMEDALLAKIREDALQAQVPVIRLQMQSFLQVLMTMRRPAKVLEIGAAVGFSALWMAYCARQARFACRITTIENYAPRLTMARQNLAVHPLGEQILLLAGDAQDVLPSLVESHQQYDLIFMDAAKGQYPVFLPMVKQLLVAGGVLVTDNVLQEGDLLESRYALERRDRTIHKRMRAYLRMLKKDPCLLTSIVPLADGAAVSIKTGEPL